MKVRRKMSKLMNDNLFLRGFDHGDLMVTKKVCFSIYEFLIITLFNNSIYACSLCLDFYKVSYKTKKSNEMAKFLPKLCRNNRHFSLALIDSFLVIIYISLTNH